MMWDCVFVGGEEKTKVGVGAVVVVVVRRDLGE